MPLLHINCQSISFPCAWKLPVLYDQKYIGMLHCKQFHCEPWNLWERSGVFFTVGARNSTSFDGPSVRSSCMCLVFFSPMSVPILSKLNRVKLIIETLTAPELDGIYEEACKYQYRMFGSEPLNSDDKCCSKIDVKTSNGSKSFLRKLIEELCHLWDLAKN